MKSEEIREKGMTQILKTKSDNPEKELEFELKFQLSLTTQERFEMMFQKSGYKF